MSPKIEKETTHNGQDDGDGIGEGHGDDPVRTDEEFLKKWDGNKPVNQVGEGWEEPLFRKRFLPGI